MAYRIDGYPDTAGRELGQRVPSRGITEQCNRPGAHLGLLLSNALEVYRELAMPVVPLRPDVRKVRTSFALCRA